MKHQTSTNAQPTPPAAPQEHADRASRANTPARPQNAHKRKMNLQRLPLLELIRLKGQTPRASVAAIDAEIMHRRLTFQRVHDAVTASEAHRRKHRPL